MPHGGGVHHHHHNGFRHHHHHHRHHYYYGGYGYRRRPCFWIIFSVVTSIVIILSSTVTLRYTASGDGDDDGLDYGPTDTRIVSVSSILCQTVSLVPGLLNYDSGYEVYLYMLNSPPKLVGYESFSLNDQPSFYSQYQQYNYFMPNGSNFSMSACIMTTNNPSITFYLVKGQTNFINWKHDTAISEYSLQIATSCETGNDTYSYSVTADDFYYLVFDSKYDDSVYQEINITMNFFRRRYEVDNATIIDSCNIDPMEYDSCSVGIPLSGSTTLLEVMPSQDTSSIDWSAKMKVDVVCSARIWMYAVFSIAALIGMVGIMAVCTVLIYCCVCKKKRETVAASAHTRTGQTVNAPLLYDSPMPGPPMDYPYQQGVYQQSPSTSYGSTVPFDAPPVYKE